MALTREEFFEASNLNDNPFRTNPVIEDDPRMSIWVGYEDQQKTLLRFLSRSRADRGNTVTFIFVFGELGSGKTHALLWSKYHITQEAKDDFDSVVYFIPSLLAEKGQASFLRAFQEHVIKKSSIVSDLLAYKVFLNGCINDYRKDTSAKFETTDEELLKQILPAQDFRDLAKNILECKNAGDITKLLSIKSDFEAGNLFAKLTNLFIFEYKLPSGTRRFKKAVYLFIDELDLLLDIKTNEARELNYLLRHLYDACPSCFCMVCAFTATVAVLSAIFEEYLLQRVDSQIVLDLLQPNEAKEFIKNVLDTARVDSTQNNGYYPFTEDAIDTVVGQMVSITPRTIVKKMQPLIDLVIAAGIDPKKGAITTQMLDDSHIWEEIG